MQLLFGILLAVGLFALYRLFWQTPIEPAAWTPPKAPPLEGVYAVNDRLAALERLSVGGGIGPEDVAIDAQGRIYTGVEDGRIVRLQPDGSRPETFVNTGGRPLGLTFDAAGNLLIADAYKGLLSVAPDDTVTVLASEHEGVPLRFTNNLDVADDGTVYFTETSTKFSIDQDMADVLENRPNGRLLAYEPATGTTRLVLDNLYFANGVAVSPDQSFVVVAETNRYRLQRVWLTGPRAGEAEVFVDNLPGFPDNINHNGRDIFWVALASPRKPDVDALQAKPLVRKLLFHVPESMLPLPIAYGFVLGLDADGRVVHNLQDPSGAYGVTTTAFEYEGMLYVGSIAEDALGRLPLLQSEE